MRIILGTFQKKNSYRRVCTGESPVQQFDDRQAVLVVFDDVQRAKGLVKTKEVVQIESENMGEDDAVHAAVQQQGDLLVRMGRNQALVFRDDPVPHVGDAFAARRTVVEKVRPPVLETPLGSAP